MKKTICLLLTLVMIFSFCACGSGSGDEGSGSATVSGKSKAAQIGSANMDQKVDVDLTSLSSTMVYAEVSNMLSDPDSYIGKKVKMAGTFVLYYATDDNGNLIEDQYYFACIVADATACCSQGIEFVLDGDLNYPEDYPSEETEITVVGEFQTYMEGAYQYCHLVNASLAEM